MRQCWLQKCSEICKGHRVMSRLIVVLHLSWKPHWQKSRPTGDLPSQSIKTRGALRTCRCKDHGNNFPKTQRFPRVEFAS